MDWLWVLSENLAEPIEATLPERSPLGDPLLGRAQGRRRDGEGAYTPELFGVDEAAGLEHLKVLDDSGERHRQRSGELTDRGRTAAQAVDEGAPGGIGERLEDAIECLGILSHT